MYTPEQLRIAFEDIAKGYGWPLDMGEVAYLSSETEKLWQGFRWGVNCDATLKAAQGGVSEAMVAELIAAGDFLAMNGTDGMVRRWERAKAALSAEPAAQGEAKPAAWCEPDVIQHMSPMAEWDGVDAIECVLLREKSESHTVPLYTAPPAQPAERVPEGWNAALREARQRIHAMALSNGWTTDSDAYAVSCLLEDMLTATPASPSEGGKGVDRG